MFDLIACSRSVGLVVCQTEHGNTAPAGVTSRPGAFTNASQPPQAKRETGTAGAKVRDCSLTSQEAVSARETAGRKLRRFYWGIR